MNVETTTLEGLIEQYQVFLKVNLTGDDLTEIAYKIKKNPKTIHNYLSDSKKAVDFLTMKAIVEIGINILSQRNIIITNA